MLAAAVAVLPYLLQGKAWAYHAYPAILFGSSALIVGLAMLFEQRRIKARFGYATAVEAVDPGCAYKVRRRREAGRRTGRRRPASRRSADGRHAGWRHRARSSTGPFDSVADGSSADCSDWLDLCRAAGAMRRPNPVTWPRRRDTRRCCRNTSPANECACCKARRRFRLSTEGAGAGWCPDMFAKFVGFRTCSIADDLIGAAGGVELLSSDTGNSVIHAD